MTFFFLYATVIALGPLLVQTAQKRSMFEVHNITCQNFTSHVIQLKCNVAKVANGRYLISGAVMYDQEFGKDTDVHLLIRATPLNGTISYNLVDVQLKMCVLTSQAFSNVLLRITFLELIRSSNFPFDCVYKPNFWYKTENYSLADTAIPVWAPFVNATVTLSFLQNRQIKWNFVLKYSLVPTRKN